VNRNTVPFDSRPAKVTSGLRVGTAALATRGFGREDFSELADVLAHALTAYGEEPIGPLRDRVAALAARYPLYEAGDRRTFLDHV
jgi:glycine hydroxymethyltransferase